MKKIFILFIFCLSYAGYSQVPGYMGKRVIVGYGFNFSGAFLSPTPNKTNDSSPSGLIGDEVPLLSSMSGFNMTHSLNIDYVYKSRKAISFLVQYARTGVDYFYIRNYYYGGDETKPAILNSLGIGIGVKLFKRSNVAPYGPYVKWETMMFMNSVKYDKDGFIKRDPNTNIETKVSLGPGKVDFQTLGVGFSFGQQRIWRDKFVFDRGLKFMVIPGGFLEQINSSDTYGSVQSGFESTGHTRLFRNQFINFHLGIGLLAF